MIVKSIKVREDVFKSRGLNYYVMLREKVKKYIISSQKKHRRIYFIAFCLRKIYDKEFVDLILNRDNIIYLDNFGNKNKDLNIYFIDIKSSGMGFGAYFRWTMHILYEADILNFVPVIRFGEGCPYKEDDIFLKTENPFEYYFLQPSDLSVNDVYKSSNVFIFKCWSLIRIDKVLGLIKSKDDLPVGYQNITENYLNTLGLIVKKYINLNTITAQYINNSMKNIFPENWHKRKILAVHVRGTDFSLHWDQHPNIVSAEEYFNIIDKAISENGFEYIFLATDDSDRLELFIKRYNNKLIYFKDVHRSNGIVNVSFAKNDREHNNYLNGLECLRDIYVMSYCNGLVAGLSQVSVCARIVNRSLNKKFEYEKIIDKGIYRT